MKQNKSVPPLVSQRVRAKKAAPSSGNGDRNTVDGRIARGGIVIQGRGARVEITQVYRGQTPSEAEQEELKALKAAVTNKFNSWKQAIEAAPVLENPYRLLQALGPGEKNRLAGRDTLVGELLTRLNTQRNIFLCGEDGVGKTSLLQAGLIPQLVGQGHLPLYVEAADEPLETSIKRQLLSSLESFPHLLNRSLDDFLRLATAFLPEARRLVILVDGLENLFESAAEQQKTFRRAWKSCAAATGPRAHWLFSLPIGLSYQLSFFKPDVNPFDGLIVLPPLERAAARQLILEPATACGIQVEQAVLDDILDRLGGANINPAELQLVCHTLAGKNGSRVTFWRMADYEASGRADGILRRHLENVLGQFAPKERSLIWQILAILAERREGRASPEWLSNRLNDFGLAPRDLASILERLRAAHLVGVQDGSYRLSSPSLRPRIQQWSDQQAAQEQARKEFRRQLAEMRASAFRGLLGGALGFVLFDQLMYTGETPDFTYLIFFLLPMAAIGGISGLLLTLSIDMAIAASHDQRTGRRYFVGGFGGAIAFALGMILYTVNNYGSAAWLHSLPVAILQGAAWGLMFGLGATWAMSIRRRAWFSVLLTALISGLILLGGEMIGGALVNEEWAKTPSIFRIFFAGSLPPLFYLAAALFGRPHPEDGDIP